MASCNQTYAKGFCVVALLLSKTYHNKQTASTLLFTWVALSVASEGLEAGRLLSNPFAPSETVNQKPLG